MGYLVLALLCIVGGMIMQHPFSHFPLQADTLILVGFIIALAGHLKMIEEKLK